VRRLHRQAMGALAAVSAVVLVAAATTAYTGSKIGLLQAEPARLAFVNGDELVRSPVWRAEYGRLEHAKAKVGQALAQDMRKMWVDRAVDKKKDTLKGEDKELGELKQVENLKRRYDAIERALAQAPQLHQVQGLSAGRPGEMLVQDPRTGQMYMLYEYHVPGAGTSAEYLGGDNGVDSDYDEVSAPSEYFATDEKGDAPFENGINRVDNMQGTYHDYAGDGWIEMKPREQAPMLYEYHVPGDYLGGDGGVESDYDAVTAPSEFYGMDQKGDAPFGDLRGYGPADRDPTFQGEYHEYEGGDWTEMKGAPQQLAQVPRQMMVEEPQMMVMRDNAGQLRLVSPRAIEGLEARRMAQLNAQRRMAAQILAMRRQRKGVHASKPLAKKAYVPPKVVDQTPTKGHFIAHKIGNKAAPNQPLDVHAAKKGKAAKKADARTEMLAEAFDSSADRTWGKVYEPKLAPLSGLSGAAQPSPALSGLAAKEFKRWDALAQKVTDVYDPMKSGDENMQLKMGHNGNWWSAKGFQGHTGHADNWWVHNKKHANNKAY